MKLGKYKPIETDGKFTFMLFYPAYKQIKVSGNSYIRNNKTGENCGQEVLLCKNIYDENFNITENITFDEDCYEVVNESGDGSE